MLNKLYIIIVVFLACGWGYSFYNKLILENKNTSLETKNSALEKVVLDYENQISFWEKEIERRNKKALEASIKKAENHKQIEKDKSGFNWYYDLSNNPVLLNFKRMHKN